MVSAKGPRIGDLFGGFSGAAVALPQSMGLGIVLFSVMGYDSSAGAVAGLVGATILLLISGGVGATVGMISAPNGPMTMLLVGVMGSLAAQGNSSATLAIYLAAILVSMGVLQIILALLGGAKLIKYIHYPVVVGLVTGVGVLMVKSQVSLLSKDWPGLLPTAIQGWYPILIAVFTMVAMFLTPRLTRNKVPGAIGGLVVGIILFYLLAALLPFELRDEWVVGEIPSLFRMHFGFSPEHLADISPTVVFTTALALTVLGMTDCLVTCLVADSRTGLHHNSKREMVAQGAAEIAIGLFGALGGWGTKGATLVSIAAGGRRHAPILAGLFFLCLMLFAGPVGNYLPVSVLAGIVAMVGIGMIDLNIASWVRFKRTRLDALTALGVVGVIVSVNLVVAVGVGVLVSILLFIIIQSRAPIIHRRVSAREHRSIAVRTAEENAILDEHGEEVLMYELKGVLFFATADKLRQEISSKLEETRVLILHFRRVRYIDMSALIVLMQIGDDARKAGCNLVLCHFHKEMGVGKSARKAFRKVDYRRPFHYHIFRDSDTAFECAEDHLLKRYGYKRPRKWETLPAEKNDFFEGIPDEYIATITSAAKIKKIPKGRKVFVAGDYGDSLFMVLRGTVEIRIPIARKAYKRLAKYEPGTFFGEIGFIAPGPRSATAISTQPTLLCILSREVLEGVEGAGNHEVLVQILRRIAIRLSEELRRSTAEIKRLEEW